MIFTARSERCLKKICLEDRFAITKDIKSMLESSDIHSSERTVRRRVSDLQFKAYRPARKQKLTAAMKVKRLKWARDLKDKNLNFWKSVSNCTNFVFFVFFFCRILVSCTIYVYKLYFPLWSMKSLTHSVFSFLMKGLFQWREHIQNLSEEISICEKAPWWKISSEMCCTDCKTSNQSYDLVCYKQKGHWSLLRGSGDVEIGPIQTDVDG